MKDLRQYVTWLGQTRKLNSSLTIDTIIIKVSVFRRQHITKKFVAFTLKSVGDRMEINWYNFDWQMNAMTIELYGEKNSTLKKKLLIFLVSKKLKSLYTQCGTIEIYMGNRSRWRIVSMKWRWTNRVWQVEATGIVYHQFGIIIIIVEWPFKHVAIVDIEWTSINHAD